MKQKRVLVLGVVIGVVIGAGLPLPFRVMQFYGKFTVPTVLADSGECECPDGLTVSGPAGFNGNVTIGSVQTPVDNVEIYGANIATAVSGWGLNTYEDGFASLYGYPGENTGSILLGLPSVSSGDVTNYYFGLISTGFVIAEGNSGGVAVGDYSTGDEGEGELGEISTFTGAYLAGNDAEGYVRAAAHLSTTQDYNGEAYLGAMRADESESSIHIDDDGNIIVILGDPAVQGAQSQQTQSSEPDTGSRHGLGQRFPHPDVSYLLGQYGAGQGSQP